LELITILKIDRSSSEPLYRQIVNELKSLIDQGAIDINQYLPSTRKFAEKLGVNRSTVVRAYEELQALGYLRSSPGSYNTVQKRRKEVEYNPERRSQISWHQASTEPARKLYQIFQTYSPESPIQANFDGEAINIAQLDLDSRLYPMDEFRRCVNHALLNSGSESLRYGSYKGYQPLRDSIAQRLRLHSISVSAEEILITNGAQQAIDLIIRLLAGSKKVAAIEVPTYANIIPILQFNGVKIQGIPMREEGMDLNALEKVLNNEEVSFVYTIPNFQNPTGITTNHQHREKLLNICLKHKVPIVEDGFEEDMKYFGKVALPIKSIDDQNIVIYLGTFSKALFPGLRIGWVTADKECIDRLTSIKRFSDLTSGNLVQMAMHEFLKKGYYDLQLKRLHRIFRKRMQLALKIMEECFPAAVRWTRPPGGYTIWVKIPKRLNETQLHEWMSKYGVIVSPGIYYYPRKKYSEYFRISIASLDEVEIQEGITRLGKALPRLC
jgi:DNA-binding transcriptional MocR family regulator